MGGCVNKQDLEMVSVTKKYGTTVAVQSISYKFKTDSYTCLLGPSGCGKSSTLRMIAGHESVSEGSIVLGGRDISHLPPAQRGTAAWQGRHHYCYGVAMQITGIPPLASFPL